MKSLKTGIRTKNLRKNPHARVKRKRPMEQAMLRPWINKIKKKSATKGAAEADAERLHPSRPLVGVEVEIVVVHFRHLDNRLERIPMKMSKRQMID